jgi:hypothetical protein
VLCCCISVYQKKLQYKVHGTWPCLVVILTHVPCIYYFLCYDQSIRNNFTKTITLLHVSTLSCHPQGACNQYLAKLPKYFKCNLHKTYVKHLNCKLYYRQLHLKYWCNLARYWLQAVWGWQDSVETCRSVIICEISMHLLVLVQNKKNCLVVFRLVAVYQHSS